MKHALITIAFCLILRQVTSDETEKTKRIQKECAEENGVDAKLAEKLADDDKLFEDKKYRCYLKCVYQKWEMIDKDGKINREALKEEFDDVNNLDAVLDKCTEETANLKEVCDRVFMLQSCILQQKSADDEARIKEINEQCVKELSLDPKVLDDLDNDTIYEDKKNRCLLKCMFTKTEYMDDAGKMNADLWIENYDDVKNIKEVFGKCLEKHDGEKDLCDKIYKFEKCIENEGN